MGSLSLGTTPIAGLLEIMSEPVRDARGSFRRVFEPELFARVAPGAGVAQVNVSRTSRRGTVRGLHYQRPPAAEAKLVRCLRGRVFDVAVDLRAGSATFLQWHARELDGEGEVALLIPPGVAHGFQALSDDVELLYVHSERWQPELEGGVRFDDPAVAVAWPLPPEGLSQRDLAFAPLSAAFAGVVA